MAAIQPIIFSGLYELGEKTHDFSRGMNRCALFDRQNRKV